MFIQKYPGSSGSWINANSSEWFGIAGGSGSYTFRTGIGDVESTTTTTVFTFGGEYGSVAAAEVGLDDLVANLNASTATQNAPFVRFNTTIDVPNIGSVPIRWLGISLINDIVPTTVATNDTRLLLNSGTFPQFVSVESYGNDLAAAKAAVDNLAAQINALL